MQPLTWILLSSLRTLRRSTPGTGVIPSFARPITRPVTPFRLKVQIERRADAVSDLAGHFVDWPREFFVVTQEISGRLRMPTPKGEIVDPDIGGVGDDLFVVGNSISVDLELPWDRLS